MRIWGVLGGSGGVLGGSGGFWRGSGVLEGFCYCAIVLCYCPLLLCYCAVVLLATVLFGLSEDPGPHAVFFSCVRRAGRGGGIQGVSVVVVAVVVVVVLDPGSRILDPGSWILNPTTTDTPWIPPPLPALRIQEKNTA